MRCWITIWTGESAIEAGHERQIRTLDTGDAVAGRPHGTREAARVEVGRHRLIAEDMGNRAV